MPERALIVCNGALPAPELLRENLQITTQHIAADGGVQAFLRDGIQPHMVIGDLDSLPSGTPAHWVIQHDPDQETNDLEKALRFALQKHAGSAVVLGALGLRTDQTLKNLSVMLQFAPHFRELLFRDERFDVFLIPKEFDRPTIPGKTVSLFPISGRVEGITLSGFRYPLRNESLENGVRDGCSNETTGYELSIRYETGALIGFFER